MIRWLLPFVVGCSSSHSGQVVDAAPPIPDADPMFCDSGADSAHITLVSGGMTKVFTNGYAGGVYGTGGLGFTGEPWTPKILFVNEPHLSSEMAQCCGFGGAACCTLEGVTVQSETSITDGQVGDLSITITSLKDAAFTSSGTLSITNFVGPADVDLGRASGSITSSDNSTSGTFANTFCGALLEFPI